MTDSRPYIATADIYVAPHVAAYRVGQAVPDEAVKVNGWEALVSRSGTKAADEATATGA